MSSCYSCGSEQIRTARRRLYEWPLLLVGLRPWRCRQCRKRFYSANWRFTEDPGPTGRSGRHAPWHVRVARWRQKKAHIHARQAALGLVALVALYIFYLFITRIPD